MRQLVHVGKPWERTISFGLGLVTSGRLLFTSGVTARNATGEVVGAGDMRKQIEQVFSNLGDIFRSSGTGFERVVRYTMYTTDIEAFMRESTLWEKYFVNRPTSTLVEVKRLVRPEMLLEVEAIVEVGD